MASFPSRFRFSAMASLPTPPDPLDPSLPRNPPPTTSCEISPASQPLHSELQVMAGPCTFTLSALHSALHCDCRNGQFALPLTDLVDTTKLLCSQCNHPAALHRHNSGPSMPALSMPTSMTPVTAQLPVSGGECFLAFWLDVVLISTRSRPGFGPKGSPCRTPF